MKIAMWERHTKKGQTYFSVAVEIGDKKEFVNAFQNNKKNDKQPDYRGDNEKEFKKVERPPDTNFEDDPF